MNLEKKYMELAIEKAYEGIRNGQAPFGACIVKADQIIAIEHNIVWREKDPTAHAEVVAIGQACKKLDTILLEGAVIYSTTEPCPMCFAACHWARISCIVYGASIQDAAAAGFNELMISNNKLKQETSSPISITAGFMDDTCRQLFKNWKNFAGGCNAY